MTPEAVEATDSGVMEAAVCNHHWVIEPPHGPTSLGICTACQATKEFHNYFDDTLRAGFHEVTVVMLPGSQLFETGELNLKYQAENQDD
ncbi:MAG: hypothetical protein ACD_57C00114G0001 [uncultured bacterium]|nr:MAG: hypothetical protein ACD_57C00114G0001 [uncultured bacterium]